MSCNHSPLKSKSSFLILACIVFSLLNMHIGVAQHTAVGSETQVNTTTNNSQQNPSVAGDNDGRFVVVWESFAQDGDDDGIFMQLYNADGSTNGSETQVNATTANAQSLSLIHI